MNISEIYKKYPVHLGLQEHMIRVGAVAKVVCGNYSDEVDVEATVSSCLLHDMGNLIKVKFEVRPELFEPEGVEYWRDAQTELLKKYGSDVEATIAIIKDAGIDESLIKIIEEASFEDLAEVARTGTLEAKILEYADMRVGLDGIIPLSGRFQDVKDRYVPSRFTNEEVDEKYFAAQNIEKEIFEKTKIKPEDINDGSTREIQKELWSWNL